MTFQEMYTEGQTISGDSSAAALIQIKQNINIGNRKFNASLGNYFTRKSKRTDLEADVQTYQLPPDCVRVSGVKYTDANGTTRPLTQVRSEWQWDMLNQNTQNGDYLTYYFVFGADEIALYPTPATTVANGLTIYYEPRGQNMTAADYTTGTVTLTDGSVTVTGSGTAFSLPMVGRILRDTDGSSGYDYRIAEYNSGTEILLEEPFEGVSGSGKTFIVGESPYFPSEYHPALVDYAMHRHFQMTGNSERSAFHLGNFVAAQRECKERYASSSSSMVIVLDEMPQYDYFRDNTISIGEV